MHLTETHERALIILIALHSIIVGVMLLFFAEWAVRIRRLGWRRPDLLHLAGRRLPLRAGGRLFGGVLPHADHIPASDRQDHRLRVPDWRIAPRRDPVVGLVFGLRRRRDGADGISRSSGCEAELIRFRADLVSKLFTERLSVFEPPEAPSERGSCLRAFDGSRGLGIVIGMPGTCDKSPSAMIARVFDGGRAGGIPNSEFFFELFAADLLVDLEDLVTTELHRHQEIIVDRAFEVLALGV